MEQETRNKLQRATQQIRRLLEEEFAEQFEGTFDILASGKILSSAGKHLDARQRLTRQKLVDAIEHIKAGGKKPQEAVEEYTREAAFTFLNRFVALRMLEARGLLQECVSKGDQSSGFKEFIGLAPGLASLPDGGYRLYLECLFDELSVEVKVLFDRRDSASLLWPRRGALTEVLDILGQTDLAVVWDEDETIGWVYQYFNSGEERKKMREESPKGPRNCRELAVRNQFFTPRYVVEFLTDNTLGRIWYEMQKGTTRLVDECRYLVRRPMEFLLRDPADCGLPVTVGGRNEMLAFWRSGNAADLPEDPSTAVVMDWVTKLANDQSSDDGFERCLRHLGDTHDAVLERLFFSKRKSGDEQAEALTAEHSIVLMHGIWRVGVEIVRSSYSDMSEPISTHPEAGPCWTALRSRLVNPPDNLSQAELLNQPVFVPHRAKKDPRDLKILDPACGSGHFLLYAFDLLLWIYEEAWRDTAGPRSEVTGKRLSEDYPELQQLHAALPGLVLAYNLHGIDIDSRAAQIAALALWMRGQRAFNEFGISRKTRIAIAKSNIVCAEPMPGEAAYLDEFIKEHLSQTAENQFLANLVRRVFEAMKLAGEAGSLLKIEEDIAEEVAKAKMRWLERPAMKQRTLFADGPNRVQKELDLTRGITDESFWEEAEQRIYDALRVYAEQADRGGSFQKRLFAADAARGFSLIDLCRYRYDVSLMNPPFGACSLLAKKEFEKWYPRTKNDVYAAFVERGIQLLNQSGMLGAITSRTGFFLSSFQKWREEVLLKDASPMVFADLGHGVMDAAMVEAAAYCLKKRSRVDEGETVFIRAIEADDKATAIRQAIEHNTGSLRDRRRFEVDPLLFNAVPGTPFAYWVSASLRRLFKELPPFGIDGRTAKQGLGTGDDFRFVRAWWEIGSPTFQNGWVPLAQGGGFSPYYGATPLTVNWANNGVELKAFASWYRESRGWGDQWTAMLNSSEYYFRPGVTWPLRGSRFSARAVPNGCIFSVGGKMAFVPDDAPAPWLAVFNSDCFDRFIALFAGKVGGVQYQAGLIQQVIVPRLSLADQSRLSDLARRAWSLKRSLNTCDETSHAFDLPAILQVPGDTLCDRIAAWVNRVNNIEAELVSIQSSVDENCFNLYGISQTDRQAMTEGFGALDDSDDTDDLEADHTEVPYVTDPSLLSADLISWAVGVAFGRFDIRFALGERILRAEPDPFESLPECSPGMLSNRLPDDYPIEISTDGTLLDDPGGTYDIEFCVRSVFQLVFRDDSAAVLHEVAANLDSKKNSIQRWLQSDFFSHQIKQYSQSRRKAPIYWQLATPSASYSVWLYYPCATKDTFFKVRNEYVKPKLSHERQKLQRLRSEGGPELNRSQHKEIEDQERFVTELAAIIEEIERIAPLWNPNFNDGVIINFSVLWRLVPQNRAWQKECKSCWDKLIAGEFDWAHLAMHLWPERVVPKCVDDASLAIAHGLEAIFWHRDDRERFKPKAEPEGGWQPVIDELVKERTSPAVKAALKSLLEAPVSGATAKSTRRRRGAVT